MKRHSIWFILSLCFSSVVGVKYYGYEVVDTIYHGKKSFLEGYLFLDSGNIVLESIGLTGESKIMLYNSTGTEITSISNSKKEFGEGITLFSPSPELWPEISRKEVKFIAQLTYRAKVIHFYAMDTSSHMSLKKIGSASFPPGIHEGWGLTATPNGRHLIMGDGSSSFYFLVIEESNSKSKYTLQARIIKTFTVHDCINSFSFVKGMNELELVPSHLVLPSFEAARNWENPFLYNSINTPIESSRVDIWANIIGTWCISVVDIVSGEVKAWINLKDIDKDFSKFQNVANGIAYKYLDGSIWVSGKHWKKSYRINLVPITSEQLDARKRCKTPWSTQKSNKPVDHC